MKYTIFFEKNAEKQLNKLDRTQQRMIVNWINKNLNNTANLRISGEPLKGSLKDYWRYRVGNYRIIADINDTEVQILIIEVGHRKDIYKKLQVR
ncbi:MAG: type II toxin-antitoxin system RelE/ParE family toxin [Sphaerochaetaceae bacterium]